MPTTPARVTWTPPPRTQPIAGASYDVRPGDTLWGIARRTLPSSAGAAEIVARVHAIASANADVIANPELIMPGWRLRLP